jgi:hypothetical protein
MKTLLKIIDTSNEPNILNIYSNFDSMATYKTASELTKMMIDYLGQRGMEVWRNNNLAVKGRAFIGRKGIGDIIGYTKKHGQFVSCEIKAIADKLSKEQLSFMVNLGISGGIAMYVCQKSDYNIVMTIFKEDSEKVFYYDETKNEFYEKN